LKNGFSFRNSKKNLLGERRRMVKWGLALIDKAVTPFFPTSPFLSEEVLDL
jgi:hypothetical protein